jgi:putative transposase
MRKKRKQLQKIKHKDKQKKKSLKEILHDKVTNYSGKLWKPDNIEKNNIKTNSWFSIVEGTNENKIPKNNFKYLREELDNVKYSCRSKNLKFTNRQKEIILKWMNFYSDMFNETLRFVKSKFYTTSTENKNDNMKLQKRKEIAHKHFDKKLKIFRKKHPDKDEPKRIRLYKPLKFNVNFYDIRSKFIKNKKTEILNESKKLKMSIPSHTLDCAIKDVCTSFKSAITNLMIGYIKHFRIRYWGRTKQQKILKLEQASFSKETFCKTILGNTVETYNGSNFEDVKYGGTIIYNEKNNIFTLMYPIKTKQEQVNKNKIKNVALDSGVRVFQTGYTNGKILEIEPKLRDKMKEKLKNIDKINNSSLDNYKKKRAVRKRNMKITNMINELQWKSIKYLTDKFENIQIGNLSTKSIISKKNNLDKITKRVASLMRLYVFKMRLKYKCSLRHCGYKEIKENCSSKTCCNCGNFKKNLGRAIEYNCTECKCKIGRDINGAKNIYVLGIDEQ